MYCWPGLRPLWRNGSWLGLSWAVTFSVVLNLALLSTIVWPQLLGPSIPQALWMAAAAIWIGAAWYELRWANHEADTSPNQPQNDDALFIQAQTEYLKGNWEEAEWLLRQRLAVCHRDIEARLLLATLYRRRGRDQLAKEQFQVLQRFDQAARWVDEIDRELDCLESESTDEDRPEADVLAANKDSDSTAEPELRKMNTTSIRRAA